LAIVFILVSIFSIFACHYVAKQRGAKPIFWGVMGLIFGPFAIPFVFLASPESKSPVEL
jgi:hypothetical protein